MKHTMKKVGAWLVTLSMVFGLLPMSAFAANQEYTYYDNSTGAKIFTITFDTWKTGISDPTTVDDAVNGVNDIKSLTIHSEELTLTADAVFDDGITVESDATLTVSGQAKEGSAPFKVYGTLKLNSDQDANVYVYNGGKVIVANHEILDYKNSELWHVKGEGGELEYNENSTEEYPLAIYGSFSKVTSSERIRLIGDTTVSDGTAYLDPWSADHTVNVEGGTMTIEGTTGTVNVKGGTVNLGRNGSQCKIQSGHNVYGGGTSSNAGTLNIKNVSGWSIADNKISGYFKEIKDSSGSHPDLYIRAEKTLGIEEGSYDVYSGNSSNALVVGGGSEEAVVTLKNTAYNDNYQIGTITVKTNGTVKVDGVGTDRGSSISSSSNYAYSINNIVGAGGSVEIGSGTHKWYHNWISEPGYYTYTTEYNVTQPTFSGTFANIDMNGRKTYTDGTGDVVTLHLSGDATINGLSDTNPINAETHSLTVDGIGADGTPVVVTNAANVTAKGDSVATVTATGIVTAEDSSKVTVNKADTVAASGTANVTVAGAVASASVGTGATLTINNNTDSSTYVSGTITGTGGTLVNEDAKAVTVTGSFAAINGPYTKSGNLTINGGNGTESGSTAQDVEYSAGTVSLTGTYGKVTVKGTADVTLAANATATALEVQSGKLTVNGSAPLATVSGGELILGDSGMIEKTGITENYDAVTVTGGKFVMNGDNAKINLLTDSAASNVTVRGIYVNDSTVGVGEGVVLTKGLINVENYSAGNNGTAYAVYNNKGIVTLEGAELRVNTTGKDNRGFGISNLDRFTMTSGEINVAAGNAMNYGVENMKTAVIEGGTIKVDGTGTNTVFGINNTGDNANLIIGKHADSTYYQNPKINVSRNGSTIYGVMNSNGAKARVFSGDIDVSVNDGTGTAYGIYNTSAIGHTSNLQVLTSKHDTSNAAVDHFAQLTVTADDQSDKAVAFYVDNNSEWAIRGLGSTFTADTALKDAGGASTDGGRYGTTDGSFTDNCVAGTLTNVPRLPLSGGTFIGKMETNKTNGFAGLILENHYVHTGNSFDATNGYDATETLKSGDKVLASNASDSSRTYTVNTLSGTHTVFDAEWELRARMASGKNYMLPVNITLGLNDYLHGNSERTVTVSGGTDSRYLDLNGLTVKPVAAASAATYTDQGAISAFTVSSGANLIVKTTQSGGQIISDLAADTISNAGNLTIGESAATYTVTIQNTNSTENIDAISTTAGTVTVNAGTIRSTSSGDGINMTGTAVVIINNGQVSGHVDGIDAASGTTLTVNNGTIIGGTNGINTAGTTTVKGGNVNADDAHVAINVTGGTTTVNANTTHDIGAVTVSNGAFKLESTTTGVTSTIWKLTQTGGTVTIGPNSAPAAAAPDAVVEAASTISGGTLNQNAGTFQGGLTQSNDSSTVYLNAGSILGDVGYVRESTVTENQNNVRKGFVFSKINTAVSDEYLDDLLDATNSQQLTFKDKNNVEMGGFFIRNNNALSAGASGTAVNNGQMAVVGTLAAPGAALEANFTVVNRSFHEIHVTMDEHATVSDGITTDSDTVLRGGTLFVNNNKPAKLDITAADNYRIKYVEKNACETDDTGHDARTAANDIGAAANQKNYTADYTTPITADQDLYVASAAEHVITVNVTHSAYGTVEYQYLNSANGNNAYSDEGKYTVTGSKVYVADGNSVEFTMTAADSNHLHSFSESLTSGNLHNGTTAATYKMLSVTEDGTTLTIDFCNRTTSAILNNSSYTLYLNGTAAEKTVDLDARVNADNPCYTLSNDSDHSPNYWVSDNPAVATVNAATGLVTAVATGTATITYYGDINGTKVAPTCTITVTNHVYGGGGGGAAPTSYTVKVDNSAVKADKTSASEGAKVTLTVKAEDAADLVVLDKNGKEVALTKVNATTYTFKMPASNVTVSLKSDEGSSVKFVDVPADAYYADAVDWAVAKGITNGVDATHFAPNAGTTRAQVVTFLWRAAGCPAPKGDASQFADVNGDMYYAKAVAWAIENGITNGTAADAFNPNAICTRAQIVTFMARFAGVKDVAAETEFVDVDANGYYAAAVAWAVENGITNGVSDTSFAPSNTCTRAQVVTFLFRLLVK